MDTIYFVSGLGADERVFYNLVLPGFNRIYVEWPKPDKRDSIESYSQKIIDKYSIPEGTILIGVSFGGMICQEIASKVKCNKVIIISSIKNYREMNWQLKFVKHTGLHHIVPAALLKWSNHLTANYYFGVDTEPEKQLLHRIINDTDSHFLKWAINAIMHWDRRKEIPGLYHIHGTADRIFPVNTIANYVKIDGGGHFMVLNRPEEISSLILKCINGE